ncbi:MAG: ClbS/DfsB family four-helix bundle protein [Anaerolineales bacterium]|nr:MAG: ClbS/DfsB family four-helix bundle protein [Anaerolineales bacterium]
MPITKQRTLDYINHEWGTYVERFNRLPKAEREKRLKKIGFESFRDMLAHILAWWEEGMTIIMAIAEGREFERKKYDFDAFNAEAVEKYKSWDEDKFLAHFEKTRQKTEADIQSVNEAAFENRRVRAWVDAVFIHHAREHLVVLSRFLAMDLLKNEWAEYVEEFNNLGEEKQKEFLSKQGFESFHDLVAHVIGWWEEGAHIISGIVEKPGFTWESRDTDAFNLELTKKYATWSDDELFKHYERVRTVMYELTASLPADAFQNYDIEGWLNDDVVGHYDEHAI